MSRIGIIRFRNEGLYGSFVRVRGKILRTPSVVSGVAYTSARATSDCLHGLCQLAPPAFRQEVPPTTVCRCPPSSFFLTPWREPTPAPFITPLRAITGTALQAARQTPAEGERNGSTLALCPYVFSGGGGSSHAPRLLLAVSGVCSMRSRRGAAREQS